jgi:hypothetical protein
LFVRVYRNVSEGRKGSVGKVTREKRPEVLRLHGEGQGVVAIARLVGLDRKQVARILDQEGIKGQPSVSASAALPQILELRRQGHGIAAIGRQLGFSRNATRKALSKSDQ